MSMCFAHQHTCLVLVRDSVNFHIARSQVVHELRVSFTSDFRSRDDLNGTDTRSPGICLYGYLDDINIASCKIHRIPCG